MSGADPARPQPQAPPDQIAMRARQEQNPLPRPTGPSPDPDQVDSWLAVEADGSVIVRSGKVELGTGVRTALAQIVAEELDVPLIQIRVVMGDTAQTPDEGYTAGSMTLQTSGATLRQVAATARQALMELASDRLDAAMDELVVEAGRVTVGHDPERTITYAELQGGRPFARAILSQAPVKRPEAYRVVGVSAPRVDLRAKFTGQAGYVQDVRLPGMLHGRVVYPPGPGAQLAAVDAGSVAGVPGLVQVVQRGNFVGVVAEREEQAVRAAKLLQVTWGPGSALPAMPALYEALRAQPARTTMVAEAGQVEAALAATARQAHATYCLPYHAHASIGPSCAVADVQPGRARVWSNTQGPNPLRGALAQLLDLPVEAVHVQHTEGPGSYGHNGSDDAAAEACLLSRAAGRPVRVQWSREQEFAWEPKAAAMVIEVRGGLDEQGRVAAWQYDAWTPTHTDRPRLAAQLLASQWMADQTAPPVRFGGGDRNAQTLYDFAQERVTMHWLPHSPLRTSSFRGLGGVGNTFANESFMDELAHLAGADPLAFRLRHLTDERARAVLSAAAERAGWRWPGPAATVAGQAVGKGLAVARYKNSGAYVAAVAEVAVNLSTGAVTALRIVVAHDCGLIVNPDGVRNQVEGNVIQALSRALKEEVTFDAHGVTSLTWETYPILTFSEIPDIDVVLLNRADQPLLGAGEPASITTAPAVANAIFQAAGARVRQMPFSPDRVRAALRS
jgi:CO/xanthine dehydrogenase Mo-binding subunit